MTTTTRAGVIRRNHGRGHSYLLDGNKAPGVTTILDQTLPKPALVDWAARATADYAVNRWDELATKPYADRLRTLERARFDIQRAAAAKGTAVHKLGEQLAGGETVDVPDELAGHVEAYVDFLDVWHVTPVLLEAVVANRRVGYCGTLDLVADLRPAPDAEAVRWLLDIKTGKAVYGDNALQLTAYGRAETYLDVDEGPDGIERPMADLGIERTGVVHVRADGWDLRPVVTDDEVWDAFRHLAWLFRHTDEMSTWIGHAVDRPAAVEVSA